jgi:hypothetical protein
MYVQECVQQITALPVSFQLGSPSYRGPFGYINIESPLFSTPSLRLFHLVTSRVREIIKQVAKMTIGNIYAITAIAVVGGGLFGFDISSQSAM